MYFGPYSFSAGLKQGMSQKQHSPKSNEKKNNVVQRLPLELCVMFWIRALSLSSSVTHTSAQNKTRPSASEIWWQSDHPSHYH